MEELGPAIDSKIASKATLFWKSSDETTISKLRKEYKIPENCKEIGTVPKINKSILNKMGQFHRRNDSKFMNTQKSISAIAGAIVSVCNTLVKNERAAELAKRPSGLNLAEVTKPLLDSLAMLSNVNNEVSLSRKKALSQSSSSIPFKEVCKLPSQSTEQLLPEDISKSIKEQKELNNLVGMGNNHHGNNGSSSYQKRNVKTKFVKNYGKGNYTGNSGKGPAKKNPNSDFWSAKKKNATN